MGAADVEQRLLRPARGRHDGHEAPSGCFPSGAPSWRPWARCIAASGSRFGDDLDLLVVDPRNQISLIPRLVRDFWRYGVGWGDAMRTLSGISTSSIVVNGRLFARGAWPPAEAVIVQIERADPTCGAEHATV